MISWFFILIIGHQAAALSIFVFEWLSPEGYNTQMEPNTRHSFSLFRTYWLVWAFLFGASVNVMAPRGFTARFMCHVWAGFAKVFLAIYTANLAAFMITREDFYDLKGVADPRLIYPFSQSPALRFGTIPSSSTNDILKTNFPQMHSYMEKHNRSTVTEGLAAVKNGDLDAFIYDSMVLEYLVGQDDECRLLTVGDWYAMTGYGIAFPKKRATGYLDRFNEKLRYYREDGDMERLEEFWLTGACKLNKDGDDQLESFSHSPISLKQFTSAFLLLCCGVALGLLLLGIESLYFVYVRKPLAECRNASSCCALVSLNLGDSLTKETDLTQACDRYPYKYEKVMDYPVCDTPFWKIRQQLEFSRYETARLGLRVKKLEIFIQQSGLAAPD